MIRPGMIPDMKTIQVKPPEILVDHERNFSRSGRPHPDDRVRELADCLLVEGQRTPIEIYPLAWVDALHLDTPEARALGLDRRAKKKAPDAYGLVAGYRRVQAALLLLAEGRTSERFDGSLSAVIVDALDDRAREDRNLSENVEHDALTPMDEAIVLGALTADPPEGRGEAIEVAVSRLHLRGGVARARTLLRLLALIPEAQDLVRLHHYDPELGIPAERGAALAGRAAEVQAAILEAARDGAGRVTPKGLRMAMAPHQGRAGQPSAPSGAQLVRLEHHFQAVLRDPERMRRAEISEREVRLLGGFARILRGEDSGLSPALDRLLRSGVERK